MPGGRPLLTLFASLVLVTGSAAGAHAVPAQDAIGDLNAQRAAHGIPAGIVENPSWSDGCRKHLAYLQQNPDLAESDPHDESPSRPGYTPEGQAAAQSAVLSSSDGYAASGDENPWEDAPIHLMQLLAPELSVTGYADAPGACMWTWPGYQRPGPEPPVLYSYPGDGTTIYASMTTNESPFAPSEFVGLSQTVPTGPHLYVLAHGADTWATRGRITAASLRGPDGPVEIRTVDNKTTGPRGDLGSYLPPGGIVIPVRPLEAGGAYTAAVTFVTDSGATLSRTWSFRTRVAAQSLSLRTRRVRRGRSFVVRYVAADRGRLTWSLRRGRKTQARGSLPLRAGSGEVLLPARVRGRFTLRAVLKTSRSTSLRATVRIR